MADTVKNKIKVGLSNCHYAIASIGADNAITYGTPVAIPGAVKISLKKDGDDASIYADDIEYAVVHCNQGYTGSLEMEYVPDNFRTDVLGETLNSDGVIIENANNAPHKFALMFEIKGDAKNRRVVFYYCSAERVPMESNTKNNKASTDSDTLTLDIKPRPDTQDVKAMTTESADATKYSAWYTAVYTPTATTTGA